MSDSDISGVAVPPMPEDEPDLGPWALEAIEALLQVDEEWRVPEDRGFTWWPHRLAQRAWAEPVREAYGEQVTRVHVATEILREVPVTDEVLRQLAEANLTATLGGFVLDPDGTLSSHSHAWFHRENIWQVNLLSTAAVLQAATCEASVGAIREVVGGRVAVSAHPDRGERPEPDEMLGIGGFMSEAGAAPSPYAPEDFETAAREGERLWLVSTTAGRALTAEVPFFGGTPTGGRAPGSGPARAPVRGFPGGSASDRRRAGGTDEAGLETALLQLTAEDQHPELGSGLLALLRLPLTLPGAASARLANDLNRAEREAVTVSPLLGSWCLAGEEVAFVSFTPAFVLRGDSESARRARLLNTAAWMTARSLWAAAEIMDRGRGALVGG
jgi:hypothetical protein